MRQRLFLIVPVVVFFAVAVVFFLGLGRDPKLVPSALIDQPVPDFTLPALNEGGAGLSKADLGGEVTLVNVFASWCVPCRVEHPLWMELAERTPVRLVAINYKDKPEAARAWLRRLGDPYSRIGADVSGRVGIDWGVYGVPETYLVDRSGRIRFKHVGPMTEEVLTDRVLPIIASLEP